MCSSGSGSGTGSGSGSGSGSGTEVVADRTLSDESVTMTFIAVPTNEFEAPWMSLLEAVLAWLRIAFPAFLMKLETLFCLKKKHKM